MAQPDRWRTAAVRRPLLLAAPVVLVAAALLLVYAGLQPTARASRAPVPPVLSLAAPGQVGGAEVPAAVPLPDLPPLRRLVPAGVLVTSERPLTAQQVRRLVRATGARAQLPVRAGAVTIGSGRTRALAVDPLDIRPWTPARTGRATAVWQHAAIGEAVLAHAVAQADQVVLGSRFLVQRGAAVLPLRAGALATTELPGVGLLLTPSLGERLGLLPGTGLLLSVRGGDTEAAARRAARVLRGAGTAEPVLSGAALAGRWYPPAAGRVTSPFGMRLHPITGLPQFHEGIDIGAPLGAPVYAMSDGQVLYAGPASGFGTELVLLHAGGVTTRYGHVSRLLVTAGAVRAGQVVALVGNEGESTGPHLHAEVRVQDRPVDPVGWLTARGVRFSG